MADFDQKQIFSQEISPLLQEIRRKCYDARIPFFFTAAVSEKNGDTHYESEIVDTAPNGVSLARDLFPKFLCVLNGFDVVPPSDPVEIEF